MVIILLFQVVQDALFDSRGELSVVVLKLEYLVIKEMEDRFQVEHTGVLLPRQGISKLHQRTQCLDHGLQNVQVLPS